MPKNKNKEHFYIHAIQYIASLIKPHRKLYFVASGLAFVSAAVGILNAKVTQWLIDSTQAGKLNAVIQNAVLLLLIIAVNYAVTRISGVSISKLSAGASRDMKRNVAAALLDADYKEITVLQAGDTFSTVNSDTKNVSDFLGGDLIGLFSQAVMLLAAVGYLLFINPLLFAVTFAYTPIGMFFTLNLNKKMQKLYPVRADRAGQALSVTEQALLQIPVIKSFLMEKQLRQKVSQSCNMVLDTEMAIALPDAFLQPACASTSSVPRILYFLFAGALVMRGEMTLGAFIAIFDLLNFIVGPSVYFPFMLNSLNRSVASINRIKRLESLPRAQAVRIKSKLNGEPALVMKQLSFGYEPDKNVISDLSFSHKGVGFIAVKGKSGSGKTTLLDLISGLLTPDQGTIEVSGEIGVLSQNSFLFSDTVFQNVLLGRQGASEDEVTAAVKGAGIDCLDGGLSVGDGGCELSGGQRQRVSLARTLLSDAPVWLLDEPTSALDADTERVILDTLERERKRRLILVSAHRASLIEMADVVLDLDMCGGETL
ncbi:MAG TPA: ABC transporter ATP-binding protein [Oscillospiraceae bacterium]|nr:ABC transporter ATP-binding protein [Oscillospiraceae bacterium]HPF55616.1 ABC transporter ATP-binding protein [Clostridiales bacterium]HPK34629.1 ABC transporter ATP-binding protein [Oscillospiraceae bacterium]HPR74606.1 ABC transporter ATP-binding protein [Oscillospiraceae bacterium]